MIIEFGVDQAGSNRPDFEVMEEKSIGIDGGPCDFSIKSPANDTPPCYVGILFQITGLYQKAK